MTGRDASIASRRARAQCGSTGETTRRENDAIQAEVLEALLPALAPHFLLLRYAELLLGQRLVAHLQHKPAEAQLRASGPGGWEQDGPPGAGCRLQAAPQREWERVTYSGGSQATRK